MKKMLLRTALFLSGLSSLLGETFFYENFDYGFGHSLSSWSAGKGFGKAWHSVSGTEVRLAEGLKMRDMPVSGKGATVIFYNKDGGFKAGAFSRHLKEPLPAKGDLWISFLWRWLPEVVTVPEGVSMEVRTSAGPIRAGISASPDEGLYLRYGTGSSASPACAALKSGEPLLIVMHFPALESTQPRTGQVWALTAEGYAKLCADGLSIQNLDTHAVAKAAHTNDLPVPADAVNCLQWVPITRGQGATAAFMVDEPRAGGTVGDVVILPAAQK